MVQRAEIKKMKKVPIAGLSKLKHLNLGNIKTPACGSWGL